MTGTPCKHQGAVAMKFHIKLLNFLPLLTPDDQMIYTYIALSWVAKSSSFYASLHINSTPQEQRPESSNKMLETTSNMESFEQEETGNSIIEQSEENDASL
ncbi:19943_t:CDS:2 [Racocetra persica]|uniref:19943_t:CDS:1 n=1 Tax=Racocetra persica TaxID=160502 RepID=A0ACA9LI44_9GLOM|nr:19943_t:CDS:2 [Racocetra persica]